MAGRALAHRNFRLFFLSQLVSVTGTWMQTLAQGWLLGTLVGWDKAAVYIGLLGVVQFLPVLTLSLFGGIVADIWPKRMTIVGTQTAAGLLALILGGLAYFHMVAVWHVFVLAFALGLVNAVEMPTRQAFVMDMVGAEDVSNAIALNAAVFNGARIVGPAVAGVMIGLLGTSLCFILNGLSYGAGILGLLLMRESELLAVDRISMPRSVQAVRGNLAEGLRYVWRTPALLLVVCVVAFFSVFGMNLSVILPIMAANVLNIGPGGYGLLVASMGAGALVSSLAVAVMMRPRYRVLIGGGVLLGASELLLASTTSVPLALTAVFLVGVGFVASAASAQSLLQLGVPGALRGRVMSVYTTFSVGSTPIGNGLTGLMGGLWGTPAALVVNGSVVLAAEAVATIAVLRGYLRGGHHLDQPSPRTSLVLPDVELAEDSATRRATVLETHLGGTRDRGGNVVARNSACQDAIEACRVARDSSS
jgi:MFS family permease